MERERAIVGKTIVREGSNRGERKNKELDKNECNSLE